MSKIYHSFAELAAVRGVRQKREKREEKTLKCRVCGAEMTYIDGTNIWICRNEVTRKKKSKTKDGMEVTREVTEPCGNFFYTKVS